MNNLRSGFIICLLGLLVFPTTINAQEVLDRVYEKRTTKEREIIPYDHIREADVYYSKRIWRIIDVREKMNLPFKYPKEPLIQILHTAAKNGELVVYDPAVDYADEFMMPMEIDEVRGIGSSVDSQFVIDPITLEEKLEVYTNELSWDKVTKFRIKEDWFFDEETSTFQVRIIGLAPVMEDYDAQGNYRGDMVMYWIYYPDLRPILVKHEVYNASNDAVRMSWEDLFELRFFTSYIFKESNVHDRRIQEYLTGIETLFESEKIKKELFEFEHDLWTY